MLEGRKFMPIGQSNVQNSLKSEARMSERRSSYDYEDLIACGAAIFSGRATRSCRYRRF